MCRYLCVVLLLFNNTWGQSRQTDIHQKMQTRYTRSFDAVTLEYVLHSISTVTNIRFDYDYKIIKGKTVTCSFNNETLEDILEQVLNPLNLTYVITKKDRIKILVALENSILWGTVCDSKTKKPLENVNVFINNTSLGSATDVNGKYKITDIPSGIFTIHVQAIGYKKHTFNIDLRMGKEINKDILVEPEVIRLDEISVTAEREKFIQKEEISSFSIRSRHLSIAPSYGQQDIMRTIQLLPGVVSTNEYKSQLHIRGGNSDQNLVLIDGGIMYNPFHFSGILSAFDVDALDRVDFFAGGFRPEFGGRLSSVMDVHTRQGSDKFSNKFDVSPISVKVLSEGPIWKLGNYLLSYRKSYVSKASKAIGDRIEPEFYDGIGRLDFNPTLKDHVSISGFIGEDVVRLQDDSDNNYIKSNNKSFAFNHERVLFKKIKSSLTITFGQFSTQMPTPIKMEEPQLNKLKDISGNYKLTTHVNKNLLLNIGATYRNIHIKYKSSDPILTELKIDKELHETAIFADGNYQINDRWNIDGGLRVSSYYINEPFVLEPRLNCQYNLINFCKLKFGVGRFSQNLVTIYNENDTYNPVDIWLPPESSMKPAIADHCIIGLAYKTPWLNISMEAYWKNYKHLTHYNRERIHKDDPFFIQGKGQSAGIDFSVQWIRDKFQIWTSYSLAKATKELPFKYPQPAMIKFSPRYDRRHNLNFTIEYKPINKLSLSSRFIFGSGMPFSFMCGAYERWSSWYVNQVSDYSSHLTNELLTYLTAVKSELDAFRFPYYHRLDISIKYSFTVWHLDITPYANILNVYNHSNVLYYDVYGEPYFSLPFLTMFGFEAKF